MEGSVPDLIISKELIERIQFSVSSRNAEAKVGECATHVFAAHYTDNPNDIKWQYVSSGVSCLLRNREQTKNGRKYMWSMSLCLYNASYGVLVWKAKLLPNSDFTAVADNFHVFALGEVNVLVGLLYSSKDKACEILTMYNKWHQERMRDDGKRGYISSSSAQGGGAEPERFRKEMISKPCNFQHIQGTQAIDECMDIEKIKADIIAAFFGLGTKAGRSEVDGDAHKPKSKKKKKEPVKQKLEFKEISLPQMNVMSSPPPGSPVAMASPTASHEFMPSVEGVFLPPGGGGGVPHLIQQNSQAGFVNLPPPGPMEGVGEYITPGGTDGYQDTTTTGRRQEAVLLPQASSASLQMGYPFPPPQPPNEGSNSQSFDNAQSGRTSQNGPRGPREFQTGSPNYQNPASPAYQEYNTSQGSYSYDLSPPRLDMNLEKEFSEAGMFPIMTAN